MKSNPKTAHVSILGPSICCNYTDQEKLGDLGATLDFGNMHDYFGVLNPGSIFYTGAYVIDYQRTIQAAVSGSKPMISTETGWGTKGAQPADEVDGLVQQKYILRGFLEHRLHEVQRVFDFLFVDDPAAGPGLRELRPDRRVEVRRASPQADLSRPEEPDRRSRGPRRLVQAHRSQLRDLGRCGFGGPTSFCKGATAASTC